MRFLKPWLQYISTPAIATFPIGAREESKTVPAGKDFMLVSATAFSVIFRWLSKIISESSFNSAGVTQLILPIPVF